MCVFKYHAFIFSIRPPRWQSETHSIYVLWSTCYVFCFSEHLYAQGLAHREFRQKECGEIRQWGAVCVLISKKLKIFVAYVYTDILYIGLCVIAIPFNNYFFLCWICTEYSMYEDVQYVHCTVGLCMKIIYNGREKLFGLARKPV